MLLAVLTLSPAWADHSAPAPQLGGVTLCIAPSSVQLRLEGTSHPPARFRGVREAIFNALRGRLEARGVPYRTDCKTARGYVLLNLYARFLDPETYVGFPENSYTYVTSAQVGAFVGDVDYETALPDGRYVGSASDIFQAGTSSELQERLTSLGEAEAEALVRAWLEANAVASNGYLLFAALGMSLVALLALPAIFR